MKNPSKTMSKTRRKTKTASTSKAVSQQSQQFQPPSFQLPIAKMDDLIANLAPETLPEETAAESGTPPPFVLGALLLVLSATVFSQQMDLSLPSPTQLVAGAQHITSNPQQVLQEVVSSVEGMGPLGPLYFGAVYTLAEVLAVPAIPLTTSAGYLFGTAQGTAVVLLSASVAAAISFVIGRTLLRSKVEEMLESQPKFAKLDKAIEKDGFKLMVLLRLSPIFPFALSNYLYGASSVGFWEYFFGTLLGFTPGTIAYVYTGQVGKAFAGGGAHEPWYVYAGGFVVLLGLVKTLADVATGIIDEMEDA